MLAGCDARGKFLMWSCTGAGSCNDIISWREAWFNQNVIAKNKLPEEYYIIGDDAFSCTKQLLTPWAGQRLGVNKDAFNYHLSARRQVIERAFGMFTRRWGIFSRRLECSLFHWAPLTLVCAILHNLCIDKNIPIPISRYDKDIRPKDAWTIFLNDENSNVDIEVAKRDSGSRRLMITESLGAEKITRPMLAMRNSRA